MGSRICQVGFSAVLLDVPLQNTSLLVTCLSAQAFCMDEIQCVAAARRGHCTLSIALSLPQSWELFGALNNLPRETSIKNHRVSALH